MDEFCIICVICFAFIGGMMIGEGCGSKNMAREAIKNGHAHYALTNATERVATFQWNTNCGVKP